MKVAIHQPNYMPWLGYFLKIYLSDIFVFHDDVQFSKSDYTKRTKVRKEFNEEETQWLSLKVKSGTQKIKEIEIQDAEETINKHLQKIYYLYHNAPFYDEYNDILKRAYHYANKHSSISLFNASLVKSICKIINIKTDFRLSSEIPTEGTKNEYNINICNHFNATEYLSGLGAKKYQDIDSFRHIDCEVKYLDLYTQLEKNPYKQAQGNFINGLSIIDAIMNIGANGILDIFESYNTTM